VVAFVRNPSKLGIAHGHLSIVQGELSDRALIERAVGGADVVLSVLGPRGGSRDKPLTKGMQNVVAAMKKLHVRRLIVTSTLSAKDPEDMPEFRARLLVGLVKLTMHAVYQEIVGVAETVRGSDLDWTIVRLTLLNNQPKSGRVRAGHLGCGEVGAWISRADIADFMIAQVADSTWLRKAPVISN
jgi:putative NADH-flavin reductase